MRCTCRRRCRTGGPHPGGDFFNHKIAKLYTQEEAGVAISEHKRILDALVSRDDEAAEEAARGHVMSALEVTLTTLR